MPGPTMPVLMPFWLWRKRAAIRLLLLAMANCTKLDFKAAVADLLDAMEELASDVPEAAQGIQALEEAMAERGFIVRVTPLAERLSKQPPKTPPPAA